jgi:hypothetical protein
VPVALVILLLDITLVCHASRTGRLQPWAFIILMVPLIGSLAYVCVELIPEWLSGPGAQQARKRLVSRLDPEKLYREISDRLAVSDTIANRAALAAECLKIARFDEAERHYDHILKLPMGGEPAYALGKATPNSAEIVLPRRSRPWMTCSSTGRTFNRRRASCFMPGRWLKSGASTRRWKSSTRSRPISRAPRRRCVTGCCLAWVGRTADARVVSTELLIQMRRAPRYLREAQAERLSIAEKQLSA